MTRQRLPDERGSITHKFTIDNREGYLTVGLYEDGRPGELFIKFAKTGGREGSLLDAWATMVSIALQSGVDVETVTSKFRGWRFEPAGLTSHPEIRMALSPLDYIARWLKIRFVDEPEVDEPAAAPEEPADG